MYRFHDIAFVALLCVTLISCKLTTKPPDAVSNDSVSTSGGDTSSSASLDAELITAIHNGNRQLLGIGMLSPTRILVIVDQAFSPPAKYTKNYVPKNCCNPAGYYVFDCDVPAVSSSGNGTKKFTRQFPLSGAVLLSKKWPALSTVLKNPKNRPKNAWVRFFIIKADDKKNYLIVYLMNGDTGLPMCVMNLNSGKVTMMSFGTMWWPKDRPRSPVSSMSASFLVQPTYVDNSDGTVWKFTIQGDPSKDSVLIKPYDLCSKSTSLVLSPQSSKQNHDARCPKGTSHLIKSHTVGFSDDVTGMYLFDMVSKTSAEVWAIDVNALKGNVTVPWKDHLDLKQILVLKGERNEPVETNRYLNIGKDKAGMIAGGVVGLIIIIIAGVFIYICAKRSDPSDPKDPNNPVKPSSAGGQASSQRTSKKSRKKTSKKSGYPISGKLATNAVRTSRKSPGKLSAALARASKKGSKKSFPMAQTSNKGSGKMSKKSGYPITGTLATIGTKASKKTPGKLSTLAKGSKKGSKKLSLSRSSKKTSGKLSKKSKQQSRSTKKGSKLFSGKGRKSGKNSKRFTSKKASR